MTAHCVLILASVLYFLAAIEAVLVMLLRGRRKEPGWHTIGKSTSFVMRVP